MPFNDPPWHPMTNQVDLKHLGKLGEECGELSQVVCRCIIQGIDEKDPTQNQTNRKWLEKEIADVLANIALVEKRFALNIDTDRILTKIHNLEEWHNAT